MTERSPLRVGVDGYPLSGRRSGIGRYVAELLMSAAADSLGTVEFTVALWPLRRPHPKPDVADLGAAHIKLRRPLRVFWETLDRLNRFGVPAHFDLLVPNQDVHFFTRYVHYSTARPVLSMVYDLAYEVVPETVRPDYLPHLRRTADRLIERSDLVGVISQALATELTAAYPGAAERIVVLRPGPTFALQGPSPDDWRTRLAQRGLTPGYLLHVGTFEPRKNLPRLVEAWRLLPAANRPPLVLVGGDGWGVVDVLRAIDAEPSVVRIPFVDDRELRALYAGAGLFVFPTLYEGFGIPVLEALSLGVPVACSDLPVLREIAGPAATYFEPSDPEQIADALSRALNADVSEVVREGRRRAQLFSWATTARTFNETLFRLCRRTR